MPKKAQIYEQIRTITAQIHSYIDLLYTIPCVYTRNSILNQIKNRIYTINLLINQLGDDSSEPVKNLPTADSSIFYSEGCIESSIKNSIESSIPGSSASGIKQLSQGIQPGGLQNISPILPSQTSPLNQTVFTLEQLSKYNGLDGNPAFVAVNGVVYDVTNNAAWAGATHFGLVAGKDLTQEFASCHFGKDILSKLRAVGRLI